ncbi:tyrosine-protein phosphatase [bacterium]|nr:tyrosine-protein phosphatase [bacterium]
MKKILIKARHRLVILSLTLLIIINVLFLSSCKPKIIETLSSSNNTSYNDEGLIIPPINDFHTIDQYNYILSDDIKSVNKYAYGVEELSRPNPITIDFVDNKDVEENNEYFIEYADNSSFSNPIIKITSERKYDLYNLKLGQDVYYRISTKYDSLEKATVYHFKVNDLGPRNLFIDGVSNVRDIGGYDSYLVENGKIRQGLFFRGAQLDDITTDGIKELLNLGIRYEIDIRNSEDMVSPFKDKTTYPINYIGIEIRNDTSTERFFEFNDEYKTIFTIIESAEEHPVHLHCQAGADRTGLMSSILLALLGASYEDIAKDFLFTNFSIYGSREIETRFSFSWWMGELDKLDGNNLSEKATNFLKSKGITDDQIENIKKAFIIGY